MVDVPPTPPPNEGKGEDERYLTLVSSTQREINRLTDEDRNTRKRGLQKLLDEVPWAGKGGSGTKKAVKQFAISILLPAILGVTIESGKGTGGGDDGAESGAVQAAFSFRGGTGTLVDNVEKVRELSLQVVKKSVENITTLSSNECGERPVQFCPTQTTPRPRMVMSPVAARRALDQCQEPSSAVRVSDVVQLSCTQLGQQPHPQGWIVRHDVPITRVNLRAIRHVEVDNPGNLVAQESGGVVWSKCCVDLECHFLVCQPHGSCGGRD